MRERVRFDIGCNLIALSSSRQIAERASGFALSLSLFLSLVRTQFKAREGNRNSCSPFMESVTVHSFVVSVVSLSCLSLPLYHCVVRAKRLSVCNAARGRRRRRRCLLLIIIIVLLLPAVHK